MNNATPQLLTVDKVKIERKKREPYISTKKKNQNEMIFRVEKFSRRSQTMTFARPKEYKFFEAPSEEQVEINKVLLQQLSDKTCRWPINELAFGVHEFCGAMPIEGSSYCGFHKNKSVERRER